MSAYPKRYLGNINHLEVHDTDREQRGCQIGEIPAAHRRWYDSLDEARRDERYDNCAWCLGSSTR